MLLHCSMLPIDTHVYGHDGIGQRQEDVLAFYGHD